MVNLGEREVKIISYWREHQINRKVREKNSGNKKFYFLDGPPFVSGDLHPGQMWVKSNKDVVIRYKRMRGFYVHDKSGYDVHGLPIENRVEKKLGIKSKGEIETLGVEEFIRQCKEYVHSYMGKMDSDYERFGMSLDFSKPYNPASKEYMETAWEMFKVMYDRGKVYEAKRSLLYCPHCEVVVSQGSLEVEYENDTDPSVYVAFKVDPKSKPKTTAVGKGETYLLIWTTTPWTLPANVAVMINPKELYVKAKIGNRSYILAKARLDAVSEVLKESAVVEGEFYGSELEGIKYFSPFEEEVPLQKAYNKYHKAVFSEEYVTMSEGTGIVHTAPGHGLEDYLVGIKNKLPIFCPVDSHAEYSEEAGALKGLKVPEDANKTVLYMLEKKGALLQSGTVTHSYPHCWRCKSKIIQRATDQWFINVQKIKKKLVSENRKVNWYPAIAQKWEEDVLNNSPDWCISRQRYWGIPMPIWRCGKCNELTVIGSLAELKERAINKEAVDNLHDLHRPHIDRIKIKCSKCGSEAERIRDILDVWFDSSIAFRASLTKEEFEQLFPVDFVAEATEQLRAWFSSLLKSSVLVYGKKPFLNIFTHGMMMDQKGRPMHKSLGNFIELSEILKQVSADAFRWHCLAHVPQLDFPFSIEGIKESEKNVILIDNISKLLNEYADAIGYIPSAVKKPSLGKLDTEDVWIVSRTNATIRDVTNALDRYEMYTAVAALKTFILGDFSRFYLKSAKKRILYEPKGKAKRIVDVINYVMYNTMLMIAPLIPFTAESIFMDHYKSMGDSVFMLDWPKWKEALINPELERDMEVAQEAITALLSSREKAAVSLRWPIANETLEVKDDASLTSLQKMSPIIEDYTNAKKLTLKRTSGSKEEVRPLYAKLGPDFKEKAKAVADALKTSDAAVLKKAIETGTYQLHTDKGTVQITKDHFTVIEIAEGGEAVPFKYGMAHIDKTLNNELRYEALLREFSRRIQLERKEMKLKKSDKIELYYETVGDLAALLKENAKKVAKELNATKISDKIEGQAKELDIEGEIIKVSVRKVG